MIRKIRGVGNNSDLTLVDRRLIQVTTQASVYEQLTSKCLQRLEGRGRFLNDLITSGLRRDRLKVDIHL